MAASSFYLCDSGKVCYFCPKQTLMTSRSLNFLPLVGALLLAACGPASRTDALLNDVESYINEAPDSARRVLVSVDSTSLRTKRSTRWM